MQKVGSGHDFATTQHTQTMEEGEPIRIATLDEYKRLPNSQISRKTKSLSTTSSLCIPITAIKATSGA